MTMRNALLAAFGGLALAFCSSIASAAVIATTYNQALSATPLTVGFMGANAFQFTAASTGYGPGAAVATSGAGKVTTLFGSVTDFEAGATIDSTGLFTFAAYPAATVIPYSAADDFVGLSVALADGIHYGYAEVFGATLVGTGFETAANTAILTGAPTTTTPEPASLALLATGLAMLSARRRQSDSRAA